jgi:protein-L-isoaspartate O-methyltransferase
VSYNEGMSSSEELAATIALEGVTDRRVLDAVRAIPRHQFVPALRAVRPSADADAALVMAHWGPEYVRPARGPSSPRRRGRSSRRAQHSAHFFQGIAPRILFDLGDFLDD